MQLPYFYEPFIPLHGDLDLNEENAKYLSSVLRIHEQAKIQLTDGRGLLATALVTEAHKKKSRVHILETLPCAARKRQVTIAISPLKNPQRYELFIEKACELGTYAIVPLICHRSEKHFQKKERAERIAISALLQSRQYFKTLIPEERLFNDFISSVSSQSKLIAHCLDGEKNRIAKNSADTSTVLIGPEGDFTAEEIEYAVAKGFEPISLGETRLRSETAGIAAAVLLNIL